MKDHRDLDLPVYGQLDQQDPAEADTSCSPQVYVSNEEVALLAAIRALKERAAAIRECLDDTVSDEEQQELERELETLRDQRSELAQRREAAYRRKMVMLGHLPPEALWE
jgi:hypothetical protein